jgi:NAD(P)-dependent dehydrogenase (short-subunit alcohol dehydrogenase family)
VNATSTLGLIGIPPSAAYAVSKHGIIGLTKSAARKVGTKVIRINCVAP